MWIFLATVTMLFAGLTSAILVRRTAPDWMSIPLPPILWVNTGLLLASSLVLERARGYLRSGNTQLAKQGIVITTVLGAVFLGGQVMGWHQLRT